MTGTMQTQTAIAPTAPEAENDTRVNRIWPAAIIFFGLGINAAWVALLGYWLVRFIKIAL